MDILLTLHYLLSGRVALGMYQVKKSFVNAMRMERLDESNTAWYKDVSNI
ncbi:MAG: hypothetical protein Q8P82_01755 [bacterium]|nr:hypothetical protein [bacterium]